MPNIIINERDLTTAGESAVNRDIVYIPGFPGYGEPSVSVDSVKFVNQNIGVNKLNMPLFLHSGNWNQLKDDGTYESITTSDYGISTSPETITQEDIKGKVTIRYDGSMTVNFVTKVDISSPNTIAIASIDNPEETPGSYTLTYSSSLAGWYVGTASTVAVTLSDYGITLTSGSNPSDNDTIKITIIEGWDLFLTYGSNVVTLIGTQSRASLGAETYQGESDIQLVLPYSIIEKGNVNNSFTLTVVAESTFTISEFDIEYGTSPSTLVSLLRSVFNNEDICNFTVSDTGILTNANLGEDSFKSNNKLPKLVETVSDFQKYFGIKPYQFSSGDYDKSYIEAVELINRGLPVLYHVPYIPNGTEASDDAFIEAFKIALEGDEGVEILNSKSDYDVKYITSGAYNAYDFASNESTLAEKMTSVAKSRGDAFAIIDHESGIELSSYMPISSDSSLFKKVSNIFSDNVEDTYATMFTPWYRYGASYLTSFGEYNDKGKRTNIYLMPASFAYLCSLAESIKNNPNWYAIAGVNRGIVPGFNKSEVEINNTIANAMQPRDGATSINAITYIRPYGYAIWGNRTLKNNAVDGNLTALSFLNIRNMVCDVKKVVYETALGLIFEQDTTTLWLKFTAGVSKLLDKMMGTGISNYKIIREPVDEKAKVKATIRLYPIYSVENFEVTIELRDDEVIVE